MEDKVRRRVSRIVAAGAVVMIMTIGAAAAQAHEAHVHGLGRLDIAIDGNRLLLHLDSPLVNLAGFEHPAINAQDRAAVQAMSRQLRTPALLFAPTPEAHCTPQPVTLVSAALPPALLDPDAVATLPQTRPGATRAKTIKPVADKLPSSEHADLDADFTFICARPALLQTLQVRLFEHFPGFHRIDAQIVTPQRQSAASLVPGDATIRF